MPWIDSSTLNRSAIEKLDAKVRHEVYNGLDCCVTMEVFEVLSEQLRSRNDSSAKLIYDFELSCQSLALSMMLRGFLTDAYEREKYLDNARKTLVRLERMLNLFAQSIWPFGLNARSYKQLKEFFYGAMQLPEQYVSDKGVRRVSCNRECLEKLQAYFYPLPIINCIFEIRDLGKKISVLSSKVDYEGRYRSSWSPSATETGRWSSSKDAFGEGGNQQNITPELRRIFVADRGKKLFHFDQEQAESRVVGLLLKALCNESTYLEACEKGDLHTNVAKLLWPEQVRDRKSAEVLFYRHFSYRDMSKRGGHLSNYKGGPMRMSRALQLPYRMCEDFQEDYYSRFGFSKWFTWTARELQLHQSLTTPLGMRRDFFGNPYDDAVLREAIAFIPQSTVGQLTALIAKRVERELPILEPLTNDHDGFTWQFPDDRALERELVEKVLALAEIPIQLNGHVLKIPIEISLGWNWASAERPPYTIKNNPDGLVKWRGEDGRTRTTCLERIL